MSAKNTLVFALVLIILLAMGAAAGSIVYSAIFLASLVNRVFVQQWIPYASYLLLVLIIIVTAYFTCPVYQAVSLKRNAGPAG